MFDPVPFVSVDRARIDEMTALLWLGRRRLSALETLCSNLHRSSYCTAAALLAGNGEHSQPQKENRKWLALPPFTPQLDASAVGKEIYGRASELRGEGGDPTTALKWVRRCCPHLPMSLVRKLFRLRQVRREIENQDEQQRVKRVSAKDAMASGDVILLPLSVQKVSAEKTKSCSNSEDETDFIRSLVLYQDPAIIVINKPPGMPVQGGVGITHSVDVIGATCLKYESSEPPRLVHRLDRDSSGILVLARTQTSASVLHSIFREKTSGILVNGVENTQRALQRKYWALVIGTPRRPKGLISAPLVKIVLEDGKSERVTIVKDMETTSSQHAVTEYKVIRSSTHGYTWLELQPLTGRKHQLRVHCAEILGTPIVGDYKYGWKAHRHLEPMPCSKPSTEQRELPFGLESEGGSISEKQPRLHLHCRQMVLPDISSALQHMRSSTRDHDLSKLEMLDLVAPLPSHMQMSWDILSY